MANVLTTIAAFVVLGGLTWGAYQLDPHWVSEDGQRCVCKVRFQRDQHSLPSRWKEARVAVNSDGTLTVAPKGIGGRKKTAHWKVSGSEDIGRTRTIYYLSGSGTAMIRLPRKSTFNDAIRAVMH